MNMRHRFLTAVVWLAGTLIGLGEVTLWFGLVEPSNNLERVHFGRDIISESEWDAQSFNSGSAQKLRGVLVNLYRDPMVTAAGTYWIRLYAADGVDGAPSTNMVASITEGRSIADLSTDLNNVETIWWLSIPLSANTPYFLVVGADAGASGLLWGYTNDPVGANGFPALFTFTGDGGATWRTPFMNALPQRMRIIADPDP